MYKLTADLSGLNKLTEALKGLHRSAYPVAVRQTLNDLAFDTKQKQLITNSNVTFTIRNKNFIKNFSKVDKADGFDVNSMVASAGMIDKGAGKTFDLQEKGGSYSHENVPFNNARVGGSNRGKISKQFYFNLPKIDRSKANRKRSKKSQFVADAFMSKKLKMLFWHGGTLFRTTQFKPNKGGVDMRLKAIYTSKKGQKVNVEATNFVEKSATKSVTINAQRFYKRAVNRQFKKYFKD